jgi:hypothetical protein
MTAMATMDDYLDGSMDVEDVFPCKGCGEVSGLLHDPQASSLSFPLPKSCSY